MGKIYPWNKFLVEWNKDWIEALKRNSGLVARYGGLIKEAYDAGSLMYPAGQQSDIQSVESRLDLVLPPSYRSFILVSNGWRQLGLEIEDARILPIDKIGIYKDILPESLNKSASEIDDSFPSDNLYFDYEKNHEEGNERYCGMYRGSHWKNLVIVSEEVQDLRYLLNPCAITNEGEWEAWNFSFEDGAFRYPSFWDLMKAERERNKVEVA